MSDDAVEDVATDGANTDPRPPVIIRPSDERGKPSSSIGLPTLVALAPMLGHRLDDRSAVASRHDADMVLRLVQASGTPLPDTSRRQDFCHAALDILPFWRNGRRLFQMLELNGSHFSGLTNMPAGIVETILATVGEIGADAAGRSPLVVVAAPGNQVPEERRPSRLLHERILYTDRIAQTLRARYGDVAILALDTLVGAGWQRTDRPAVVLGYIPDLLRHMTVREGAPELFGRGVAAIMNERFIWNLVRAHGPVDPDKFLAVNRCYEAVGSKAIAYRLANSFKAKAEFPIMALPIPFGTAGNEAALLELVSARVAKGDRVVIKPSGTNAGYGIEFFLGRDNDRQIRDRIGSSLATVRQRYDAAVGFPYTVADYLDADAIDAPGHVLHRRKFELRVVVYRDGSVLRALPSIAKVAPEPWEPSNPTRAALLNNVSASMRRDGSDGAAHMLPLCSHSTLALIRVHEAELVEVCRWSTAYVAHVLAELPHPAVSDHTCKWTAETDEREGQASVES